MAKVITLSRTFQKSHPRSGEPTFFVEKVWRALGKPDGSDVDWYLYKSLALDDVHNVAPKLHTVRAGKRWKTGDMCSLRVWSGKPYNTPQIVIAPDFKLARVADIEIDDNWGITIDGVPFVHPEILAANDGLSEDDFCNWIGMPFSGQILFFTDTKTPY